jgi:hypothetical protein
MERPKRIPEDKTTKGSGILEHLLKPLRVIEGIHVVEHYVRVGVSFYDFEKSP